MKGLIYVKKSYNWNVFDNGTYTVARFFGYLGFSDSLGIGFRALRF